MAYVQLIVAPSVPRSCISPLAAKKKGVLLGGSRRTESSRGCEIIRYVIQRIASDLTRVINDPCDAALPSVLLGFGFCSPS